MHCSFIRLFDCLFSISPVPCMVSLAEKCAMSLCYSCVSSQVFSLCFLDHGLRKSLVLHQHPGDPLLLHRQWRHSLRVGRSELGSPLVPKKKLLLLRAVLCVHMPALISWGWRRHSIFPASAAFAVYVGRCVSWLCPSTLGTALGSAAVFLCRVDDTLSSSTASSSWRTGTHCGVAALELELAGSTVVLQRENTSVELPVAGLKLCCCC